MCHLTCCFPQGVRVVGTPNRILDGQYLLQDQHHNGHPLFQKEDDVNTWLRCTPRGRWTISPSQSMQANDNRGFLYSQEKGLPHPAATKSWHMAVDGRWESTGLSVEEL